jgi:hypothetical protein
MYRYLEIIETYRQADCEMRLSLFLQHRALRTLFVQIDQRETETEKRPAHKASNLKTGGNWVRSWALGLLRFY